MKKYHSGLNRLELFALTFAVGIYTAFFTPLSIQKYLSFFSFNGNPLAEDNNMLWHTIRGQWFYQSIGERLFNSDTSLFYIIIAMAYKFFPHIYTIFVLRHLVLALGVWPIYLLARAKFESKLAAVLFSLSYLLFNPLHHLSFMDDESFLMVFSLLFILFAFYFYEKKRFVGFVGFSVLAILAKAEDSFFIIPMFSLLAYMRKMPVKWKLTPLLLGGGYLVIDGSLILPVMNQLTGGYTLRESIYVNALFGSNPQGLPFVKILLNNMISIIQRTCSLPRLLDNILILSKLFDPFIYYLSIFAPALLLLGLPVLAAAQVSWYDHFLTLELVQHVRYLIIFIFIGSIFGIARIVNYICSRGALPPWLLRGKLCSIFGAVFVVSTLCSNFGPNILLPSYEQFQDNPIGDKKFMSATSMYDPAFYTQDEKDASAWAFIRSIPQEASVSTTQYYLAALSARDKVYHFGSTPEINWTDGHDFDADFIFVNKQDNYPGYGGVEVQYDRTLEQLNKLRADNNYEIEREDHYFCLFKKKNYGGSIKQYPIN